MTKYIRIGIGDKNDNPPYFDQAQYEAEVNEDEDIQHSVISVTAKDAKGELPKIRHEITRGNIGAAFAVKNETGGAIYPAPGPLEYENRKEVSDSQPSPQATEGQEDPRKLHTLFIRRVRRKVHQWTSHE